MSFPDEICNEIRQMADRDQQVRWRAIEQTKQSPHLDAALLQVWQEMDRLHTARVSEVIAQHGWPVLSSDGVEIARAVWLLVQHADHDPAFQRLCLDHMTTAVDAGEADQKLWAMLTDRVLMKETGEQLYGTQWTQDPKTGHHVPSPLADPPGVDRLRVKVGLDSLSDNKRRIQEMYGNPPIHPSAAKEADAN